MENEIKHSSIRSLLFRKGAELGVPLAAIAYACQVQGLTFLSLAPVAIVAMFAVVQAALKYFLLDVIADYFVGSGKEEQYWSTLAVVYGFLGLGMVQLFQLIVAPA